jgi:hypothetical protein
VNGSSVADVQLGLTTERVHTSQARAHWWRVGPASRQLARSASNMASAACRLMMVLMAVRDEMRNGG